MKALWKTGRRYTHTRAVRSVCVFGCGFRAHALWCPCVASAPGPPSKKRTARPKPDGPLTLRRRRQDAACSVCASLRGAVTPVTLRICFGFDRTRAVGRAERTRGHAPQGHSAPHCLLPCDHMLLHMLLYRVLHMLPGMLQENSRHSCDGVAPRGHWRKASAFRAITAPPPPRRTASSRPGRRCRTRW